MSCERGGCGTAARDGLPPICVPEMRLPAIPAGREQEDTDDRPLSAAFWPTMAGASDIGCMLWVVVDVTGKLS